ncbi:hypothetical protein ACU8KH_05196 [Lachancea thermotolerans]
MAFRRIILDNNVIPFMIYFLEEEKVDGDVDRDFKGNLALKSEDLKRAVKYKAVVLFGHAAES